MFIGGHWRGASDGGHLEVLNPATVEVLGETPAGTVADVEEAIATAAAGLKAWSRVPGWERAKVLRAVARRMEARRDQLAMALTLEVGRPLQQSLGEAQAGLEQFDWFAGEAERLFGDTLPSRQGGQLIVSHEPVGVVAAFTAWNFPINLLARKIAPALAAGCTIICRPSEQATSVATILVECCLEGGVPKDVIQLVTGKAATIANAIMASDMVRKVSLTGSTAVGKELMAAAAQTVKRCSMELGGHSPVIVCDDVDVKAVANLCAQFKFRNAGQVCIAPNRFYVHESVAPQFKATMVEHARALKLGDGRDPSTGMGPLTTRRQLDRIESLAADTEASGAAVLTGARRPKETNKGFFFAPTVFADVPNDARIMRDEPFGPLAPVNTFRDVDEAIARANDTEYGLAAYVFTRSLGRAQHLAREVRAGMVGINTFLVAHAEAPFGGVKHSGMGREGGRQAVHDYLDVKLSHFMPADRPGAI
jgi:succinate-semialdehyde dehydrogenase/glutarate-semialdehyde dehydrogenase